MSFAIDFTPLTMTELRNRPGDILDRVANGGECFAIERHGRRRACLVPLSVFLPDITPSRIANELEQLAKVGEAPRTTVTGDREIAFKVWHSGDGGPYDITIVLPNGYPNVCPRVYADSIASGTPHRFSDGALCIFGAMTSWNPGNGTVCLALEHARRWLKHYEIWQTNGEWPNPGVTDERK